MQAGSLVGSDVRALTTRILVAGVQRSHESWSVDREIVGDLPDQVVAGGGIRQATGTVVWAEQSDLTDKAVNPWNGSSGWLPKRGDTVQVLVSDGVTEWPQFVGVIDETSGSTGDAPQSTIIDYTDSLNRFLDHPTVFRIHPPTVEGGGLLAVGMGPAYIVDRALRLSGFYCTPRQESGSLVSVPGQTSLWAERGMLTSAPSSLVPVNYRTSWGWAIGGFSASYSPTGTATRADSVQLTVRVAAEHTGTFTLAAAFGVDSIQLVITSGRVASCRYNGAEKVSLPLGTETIVTLLVKGGVWTVRTPTATAAASFTLPAGSDLTSVTVNADANSRVAGMQVTKPFTPSWEFYALRHVDSYFGNAWSLSGTMDVLRSFSLRSAADLLAEISKATLAPFWFDELGNLQFISSDLLIARAPVQTVTTLDDITKLSWLDSLLSVRSSVTVEYQEPTISRSRYSNITLWQGGGESLESGQVASFIADEPTNEDWAEVDTNAGGLTLADFNAGRGTWNFAYLEDASGATSTAVPYVTWSGVSKVGMEAYKISLTAGTMPAGTHMVVGYPPDSTSYNARFRGKGSPIIRGRGKVVWADLSVKSAILGPAASPDLVHNAGPWLSQEGSTILQTRVADFIASQVSAPKPVITGMDVIYDPRRQLGDVITISSPTYMGVELTALIVGIKNSAAAEYTQTLDVRIITSKTTFTTYAAHEAAYPDSLTYEQWRLLYPDTTTYNGFNADPLRGA